MWWDFAFAFLFISFEKNPVKKYTLSDQSQAKGTFKFSLTFLHDHTFHSFYYLADAIFANSVSLVTQWCQFSVMPTTAALCQPCPFPTASVEAEAHLISIGTSHFFPFIALISLTGHGMGGGE